MPPECLSTQKRGVRNAGNVFPMPQATREYEQGAKPKEIHGFICAIVSVVAFFLYVAWAYIPEQYLQAAGISYYPSKYWAVALPAYTCLAIFLGLVFYTGLNYLSMPGLDSLTTMTDKHSRPPMPHLGIPEEEKSKHPRILPISDLPLTDINDILFG